MADDIFFDDNDDDDGPEELIFAEREFQQDLKRIENSAFHEGYEEAQQASIQKAFDAGYDSVFPMFHTIARLEALFDVLSFKFDRDENGDVKERFGHLYRMLEKDLEEQTSKKVQEKAYDDLSKIKPTGEVMEEFEKIKTIIIKMIPSNNDSIREEIDELKL